METLGVIGGKVETLGLVMLVVTVVELEVDITRESEGLAVGGKEDIILFMSSMTFFISISSTLCA